MNLQELPKPLDKDPDLLVGSPAWLKTFEDKVMAPGSRAWMADKMTEIFSELQVMRECGQKEYAHDEQDAFANFRRIGKELEIPMEKVLMVYLLKHKDGVVAHINGHVSQREDVRGRLKDWMVYICLLWGMFDAA